MRLHTFQCNILGENTYLLWDKQTLEAAIIDAGMQTSDEQQQVTDFIRSNSLHLTMSLQTHLHFDHTFGLPYLCDAFGLHPQYHEADETVYQATCWMAKAMHLPVEESLPRAERYLHDGDLLTLGHTAIQVIHTPGHTPGGLCFYLPNEGLLFSGDTLFRGSMGRADLPGGSLQDELTSIRTRLLTLPPTTKVYPGHGPSTTISDEIASFQM